MSIQTELTRIINAKAAIKTSIEGKGVTVPADTLLDGMASLIESIEAGGGGGVRVEQGSVTFAEAQQSYTFVEDHPDIFIVYIEDDSKPTYISSQYIWAMIQDTRLFEFFGEMRETGYVFGYTSGSKKYYVPYKAAVSSSSVSYRGRFSNGFLNAMLGPKTYKWYAIYGVTAT